MSEYTERLQYAIDRLEEAAMKVLDTDDWEERREAHVREHRRLRGKIEGVSLALSYATEMGL